MFDKKATTLRIASISEDVLKKTLLAAMQSANEFLTQAIEDESSEGIVQMTMYVECLESVLALAEMHGAMETLSDVISEASIPSITETMQ